MLSFERGKWSLGYTNIAGVDEVGRGPLAGPVVAAAVIFHKYDSIDGINDSKKLSAATREKLFEKIIDKCKCFGIGMGSIAEIDRFNIFNATKLAMHRAIYALSTRPDLIVTDAVKLETEKSVSVISVIKGDEKIRVVAAASIVAKVVRDELVRQYDYFYPEYGFSRHKGYGTAFHLSILSKLGATPVHRTSFAPVAKTISG